MIDSTQNWRGRWDEKQVPALTAVADAAGMVWAHSNPAELYRWISRRNALLSTIGVAFALAPGATSRPLAG